MTSERLGRLRAWIEQAAGKEVAFVYSDGILRLLDEREALLAPLRALLDAHCTERDESSRGCHCFYAVEHATARAALAKAESP